MSAPDTSKIEVLEHGAGQQASDRRLYMQLSAFGGCLDAKPLHRALESSRIEWGVLNSPGPVPRRPQVRIIRPSEPN